MERLVLGVIVFVTSFFLPFGVMHIASVFPAAAELVQVPQTSEPTYTYTNASNDSLFVVSPEPGEHVSSTFIVTGFARGNWFFEASFPVQVFNKDNVLIGETHANAKGDWMTTKLVSFTVEVFLKSLYNGPATVVLKNDNPSGDPARDASVSFPIVIQ